MNAKSKLKTATAVAVAISAVFGICVLHGIKHRQEKPVAEQKAADMRVTVTFQASFDGSNWFALTNLSYGPVTVTNLADFDITKNIHYIRTLAR